MSIKKNFRSQTHLLNDDCAYKRRIHESTSPLLYNINPIAYESCTKCHQAYPGFIGALGGKGFGIGPNRIDIDSELRNQSRLLSRCPSHKYNPTSYKNCGSCKKCDQGLPCGCQHCATKSDVSRLQDCRPGIIPIESLDTRAFGGCNTTKDQYLDRFDYLCTNPQAVGVFHTPSEKVRLGANTRQNIRDFYGNCKDANRPRLPNMNDCRTGSGLGCRNIKNGDFGKGIFF